MAFCAWMRAPSGLSFSSAFFTFVFSSFSSFSHFFDNRFSCFAVNLSCARARAQMQDPVWAAAQMAADALASSGVAGVRTWNS